MSFGEFDSDLWQTILTVRPGITDLATLLFRNEEEILRPVANVDAYYRSELLPTKLWLNVRYLQSQSISRDVRLLWMTVRYSFFPRDFNCSRVARSLGVSHVYSPQK
jgi:lipopolysaccharide/colanic/teichoic acid biosynthesis glycosyltransferase